MRTVMQEVATWEELKDGGTYLMVSNEDGTKRHPIVVCPKCLKPCSCSQHTLIQEKPLTIRASFLCPQVMPDGSGPCRFHAYITDGVMEET